ncbi:MAG: hypothetical protein WDN44_13770 [Sphingomonas sp.]
MARAMQSRDPAAIDAVMAELRGRARQAAGYAENAMQFAAALGRNRRCVRDRPCLLPRSRVQRAGDPLPPRAKAATRGSRTGGPWFLFFPIAAAMRADARFRPAWSADLGLKRYWHEASVKPRLSSNERRSQMSDDRIDPRPCGSLRVGAARRARPGTRALVRDGRHDRGARAARDAGAGSRSSRAEGAIVTRD